MSVTLLIVVASLFAGFINAFEQSAVETIGDIVLTPPVKFAGYPLLIERLKQIKGVEAATAVLSSQGLLHLGQGNVRAVEIWGIQPAQRAAVTGFKQSLLKTGTSSQPPSFTIPDSANKMGGYVGIGIITEPNDKTDEYDFGAAQKFIGRELVLTTGTITSAGSDGQKQFKRKTVEFTVSDIVFSGIYEIDKSFVYLPIEELQKILYPDEAGQIAQQVQIKLADGIDADAAIAQMQGIWEDFAAKNLGWDSYLIKSANLETSRQMQSQYVAEFRKQMDVLLLIFGIVSFSVVLLILCIFYMIVITRRKDIAIIKSCGASNSSVAVIFVGFGACIGLAGSLLGTISGYVITKNINAIEQRLSIALGLKLWKSSIYMFSKIPNEVDWNAAWHIVFWAVVAAAVGTLIPSVVAAMTKPVDILRYE